MISIYDTAGIEQLRRQYAMQPHQLKQFLNALFKKSADPDHALEILFPAAKQGFKEQLKFQTLTLIKRQDSQTDGASKLLFRTEDQHLIETVILRPKTGRTSLCISSQIGCACRCSFCATGKMGFIRNLTTAEILDQVMLANHLLKAEDRAVRNVVFMGMGEPLLNPTALYAAIDFLTSTRYFNYSPARLMISTVGIPDAMIRFSKKFPKIPLALSLHSARQEVRETLIPYAKKYPLEDLWQALKELSKENKVMIEYLLLKDLTDTTADLAALQSYLKDLSVHINIIPYNSSSHCELEGTSATNRQRFIDTLKEAGFEATLRYSLGRDIAAACGQLVQQNQLPS